MLTAERRKKKDEGRNVGRKETHHFRADGGLRFPRAFFVAKDPAEFLLRGGVAQGEGGRAVFRPGGFVRPRTTHRD
jgi:hypothetical protein